MTASPLRLDVSTESQEEDRVGGIVRGEGTLGRGPWNRDVRPWGGVGRFRTPVWCTMQLVSAPNRVRNFPQFLLPLPFYGRRRGSFRFSFFLFAVCVAGSLSLTQRRDYARRKRRFPEPRVYRSCKAASVRAQEHASWRASVHECIHERVQGTATRPFKIPKNPAFLERLGRFPSR